MSRSNTNITKRRQQIRPQSRELIVRSLSYEFYVIDDEDWNSVLVHCSLTQFFRIKLYSSNNHSDLSQNQNQNKMKCCISSNKKDTCGGVLWPNGAALVLPAQLLLIAGVVLSGMAMFDCNYVNADIGDMESIPPKLVGIIDGEPSERRGFGFYVHENGNEECRWNYWNENSENVTSDNIENYVDTYTDFMGQSWKAGRVLGMVALVVGFLLTAWSMAFGCLAHIRPFRYAFGATLTCLVAITQLLPLIVLKSDFCSDRDCTLGASGIYGIVAGGVFFVSGFFFFAMLDYPGEDSDEYDKRSLREDEEAAYEAEGHGHNEDTVLEQDHD